MYEQPTSPSYSQQLSKMEERSYLCRWSYMLLWSCRTQLANYNVWSLLLFISTDHLFHMSASYKHSGDELPTAPQRMLDNTSRKTHLKNTLVSPFYYLEEADIAGCPCNPLHGRGMSPSDHMVRPFMWSTHLYKYNITPVTVMWDMWPGHGPSLWHHLPHMARLSWTPFSFVGTPPTCVFGEAWILWRLPSWHSGKPLACFISGSHIICDGEPQQWWNLVGLVGGIVIPLTARFVHTHTCVTNNVCSGGRHHSAIDPTAEFRSLLRLQGLQM